MISKIVALTLICLLTGCGTVGKVISKTAQVIRDPSVQIGGPQDQKTRIAFSLFADPTTNPNPNTLQDQWSNRFENFTYEVNLVGADKNDLELQLRELLLDLEHVDTLDELTEAPAQVSASHQPRTQNRALGQYASEMDETVAPIAEQYSTSYEDTRRIATPIAFKILQLRDDTVFLNTDHDTLIHAKKLSAPLGSTYIRDDDYILKPGQFKYVDFEEIHSDTRFIAVMANFHDIDSATWKQVLRIEPMGQRYSLLISFNNRNVNLQDESVPSDIAQPIYSCPIPPYRETSGIEPLEPERSVER